MSRPWQRGSREDSTGSPALLTEPGTRLSIGAHMVIDARAQPCRRWNADLEDDDFHTSEDHAVWRHLFEQQTRALEHRVCPEYGAATARLGLGPERIPRLGELNDRLGGLGGWRVVPVEGFVAHEEYFALVARRHFPVAARIRSAGEMAHSRQPDIFHDIFGHVPLLTHPAYDAFVVGMAELALEHAADEKVSSLLSRAMKWTVEYGLVRDADGGVRVYGAGLISSSLELEHVLGPVPELRPFTAEGVLSTTHTPASLQPAYFVIESVGALGVALSGIRAALAHH